MSPGGRVAGARGEELVGRVALGAGSCGTGGGACAGVALGADVVGVFSGEGPVGLDVVVFVGDVSFAGAVAGGAADAGLVVWGEGESVEYVDVTEGAAFVGAGDGGEEIVESPIESV